jgi:preprotein translocase subunit SecE
MKRVSRYLSEVWAEMKKATWPWDPKEKGFARYKELSDATVVVFISMIILAGFVGAFDFLLRKVFEGVISL